jgi:hypothetical protein
MAASSRLEPAATLLRRLSLAHHDASHSLITTPLTRSPRRLALAHHDASHSLTNARRFLPPCASAVARCNLEALRTGQRGR